MNTELKNQVALVTGSSSGIGRAVAVAFAQENAKVAITYKSNAKEAEITADMVRSAGGEAFIVRYDLNDEESIKSAISAVASHWGTIHILVNNAVQWASRGEATGASLFEDTPSDQWKTMIRSSVEGAYYTIQQVVPYMRKNHWGRIINVSSTLAEDGLSGSGSYSAAKAALHGLSRSMAVELGRVGIHTNVVMPGMTLTERAEQVIPKGIRQQVEDQTPTGRLSKPEDVASLIVYLGSNANGHVNGEIIRVSGGL
ncbi:SDR family NAD(P)-dependent oxidoreductase [Bacillus horti]|uniref:3-oxoacyl-[acyl-carrier protein] reductase n=1 Tax=Caldalkalibacillus horti TaxID=77523 RepID=A0ABT9VWH1_9BACI|nr:SDR family oxidoreductase [Bacillus horti]MDQ0165339.1 3-oxoacyl-[acyl-carrier protein] reductase [Bacillus horti]